MSNGVTFDHDYYESLWSSRPRDVPFDVAPADVLAALGSTDSAGLSAAEAERRIALQGGLNPTSNPDARDVIVAVIRDGQLTCIPASRLVFGDWYFCPADTTVEADLLLLSIDGDATAITVDESFVTGETDPVKVTAPSYIHGGSKILEGRGTAVVVNASLRSSTLGRLLGVIEADDPSLQAEGDGDKLWPVDQRLAAACAESLAIASRWLGRVPLPAPILAMFADVKLPDRLIVNTDILGGWHPEANAAGAAALREQHGIELIVVLGASKPTNKEQVRAGLTAAGIAIDSCDAVVDMSQLTDDEEEMTEQLVLLGEGMRAVVGSDDYEKLVQFMSFCAGTPPALLLTGPVTRAAAGAMQMCRPLSFTAAAGAPDVLQRAAAWNLLPSVNEPPLQRVCAFFTLLKKAIEEVREARE